MDQIILSKAKRISQNDPDIQQNILAWNFQNNKNASAKGKALSIGEQIKFMRRRAAELRAGKRRYFGNNGGHLAKDVFNKNLYYSGKIKLLKIHYEDESGNEENPNRGRSEIAAFTSIKDVEAGSIFNLDLEVFLDGLSKTEKTILLKKLEGLSIDEIGEIVNLSRYVVTARLKNIGKRYGEFAGIFLA
ncbi:sigma-70 family RNA polymerase sigma factor [candidate division KSB1 bacterium]|nr:sigma-70 family RNA polymerase sigma factor [candidate division KSB1 bacterium]